MRSNVLRSLPSGTLSIALALSVAACGSVGTGSSNGMVTANQVPVPNQPVPSQPVPNQAGAATLTWTPVTESTDGTVLADLAGYTIYYRESASDISDSITLPDPTVTTYVVTDLSAGTWYFTVAAYTSTGIEGVPSNVASKTIN